MGHVSRFVRVRNSGLLIIVFATVAVLAATPAAATVPGTYVVTPLVLNGTGGVTQDTNLVNAWGLVAGPTSPWWVSDNGADLSTLYNAAGAKIPLEVHVAGAPTGVVFNGDTASFQINGAAARFIFATESGTIAGWVPGTTAAQAMVTSSSGVYKGLAIATTDSGPQLYATDFHNARVDVVDGSWAVQAPSGFVDPKLPSGYAPFGIQTIGDRIFVTYAKQTPGSNDETAGPSLGFVDAYDAAGNLLARVAQRGLLNAPWGLAMAPAGFGVFSGAVLVGNFGDGHINAYQEQPDGTFQLVGALRTGDGHKLAIDGLWAIEFGHGATANGRTNTLFFTAGPNDEADGLFGTITAA